MKERQFAGILNSKSVYGQSYSSSSCLRSMKLGRLLERSPINYITCKWSKRSKYLHPSWSGYLYNYPGDDIVFTQRQHNTRYKGFGRKPKVKLFRWKVVRMLYKQI